MKTILFLFLTAISVCAQTLRHPVFVSMLSPSTTNAPPTYTNGWTPSNLTTVAYWLRSDAATNVDGGAITYMPSLLTTQYFNQGTINNKPILDKSTNTLNSLPAIWFYRANSYFSIGGETNYAQVDSNVTVYVVFRQYTNGSSALGGILDGTYNTGFRVYSGATNEIGAYVLNSNYMLTNNVSGNMTSNQCYIYWFRREGATMIQYIQGIGETAGTLRSNSVSASAFSTPTTRIGYASTGNRAGMYLYELLYLTNAISGVSSSWPLYYLSNRYAIPYIQ